MAPEGTITVTLVAVAVVTLARVAPKNTMLLLGAVLKLVPVRVIVLPGVALMGLKEVIMGIWAKVVQAQPINITKNNKGLRLQWFFFIMVKSILVKKLICE